MSSLADGQDPNTGNPPGVIMNSLPSNMATFYLEQLTFWQSQVATLQSTYQKIAGSTLDEYTLTSGDGMTRAKRRDLSKMGQELQFAVNRMRYYYGMLYGRGLMVQRLRRKA